MSLVDENWPVLMHASLDASCRLKLPSIQALTRNGQFVTCSLTGICNLILHHQLNFARQQLSI
jgi:hypothetical protein